MNLILIYICFSVLAVGYSIQFVQGFWGYKKRTAIPPNDGKINRSLACGATTAIDRAPPGQTVKVSGRIKRHDKILKAPFSGRECVFYEVFVEERHDTLRDGHYWHCVVHDAASVDFLIEDDTGLALIKKDKLKAALRAAATKDYLWEEVGLLGQTSPDLEAFMVRHGQSTKGLVFNKKLRYREGVFELDEEVIALGTAIWEHAPEGTTTRQGYRGAAQRLVLGPLPGGSILMSDSLEVLEKMDESNELA
ncbi:MAG TPA: hypothetical protein PK156_12165 [Polyangium sp.]|nr:hypothetical protein [Polyangium sp.]